MDEKSMRETVSEIHKLEVNSNDEIGSLYKSIDNMSDSLIDHLELIKEEQKLSEDLRVAKASSEAKSSFLSNMSHEIRTPINAILGMNEMILREFDDPKLNEYAVNIETSGHSLLSLVNDILDFSKIEAGKMEILPVEYDLSSVINDLINMSNPRAKAKNLELKVLVDETMPHMLYGDDVRIKQCA
ncbi:MAG: hybrid sensor histidine kinase/response regulator, partial [Lachnospiraceae bacterium]|nr:hybrid sensor histidine kinase/response regulator [Lachnospiraceae bacterium]